MSDYRPEGCNCPPGGKCRKLWILAVGYANNPDKQRFAIVHAHRALTETEKRQIAEARASYAQQPDHIKALCEKIKNDVKEWNK